MSAPPGIEPDPRTFEIRPKRVFGEKGRPKKKRESAFRHRKSPTAPHQGAAEIGPTAVLAPAHQSVEPPGKASRASPNLGGDDMTECHVPLLTKATKGGRGDQHGRSFVLLPLCVAESPRDPDEGHPRGREPAPASPPPRGSPCWAWGCSGPGRPRAFAKKGRGGSEGCEREGQKQKSSWGPRGVSPLANARPTKPETLSRGKILEPGSGGWPTGGAAVGTGAAKKNKCTHPGCIGTLYTCRGLLLDCSRVCDFFRVKDVPVRKIFIPILWDLGSNLRKRRRGWDRSWTQV